LACCARFRGRRLRRMVEQVFDSQSLEELWITEPYGEKESC
jgi:hypothetical protein